MKQTELRIGHFSLEGIQLESSVAPSGQRPHLPGKTLLSIFATLARCSGSFPALPHGLAYESGQVFESVAAILLADSSLITFLSFGNLKLFAGLDLPSYVTCVRD